MAGSSTKGPIGDSGFIARANAAKRFIQTVGMFLLCVVAAFVAAMLDMAGLVAVLAALSAVPGIPAFLWLIERSAWHADRDRIPRALQNWVVVVALLVLTLAVAVVVALALGARLGILIHPIVYGAEYALAVSIRHRRLSRASDL